MIKTALAYWTLIAFFAFFLAVAVWTYLPRYRTQHEEHGRIPFKDDGHE